jgi:hypothetical protein
VAQSYKNFYFDFRFKDRFSDYTLDCQKADYQISDSILRMKEEIRRQNFTDCEGGKYLTFYFLLLISNFIITKSFSQSAPPKSPEHLFLSIGQ